jgi:hypothetical protein
MNMNSRIDVYIDGKWKLVGPSHPIPVDKDHPLLIHLRHDLLRGITDEECLGIQDEYNLQPKCRPTANKRSAHPLASTLQKTPRLATNLATDARPASPPLSAPSTNHAADAQPASPLVSVPSLLGPPLSVSSPVGDPSQLTALATMKLNQDKLAEPAFEPADTSSKAKVVWPSSFYTCDVSAGLRRIELLCNSGAAQSTAFNKVFSRVSYAKSTFCHHKADWHRSSRSLREDFINYGRTTKGLFSNYLLARRGKAPKSTPPPKTQKGRRSVLETPEPESPLDLSDTASIDGNGEEDDLLKGVVPEGELGQLCPYCNEPLPDPPSETLKSLHRRLLPMTRPAQNLENPNARSGRAAVYMNFCERHQFENKQLPMAKARGWPIKLEFSQLPGRIKGLSDVLTEFVEGPEADGPNDFLKAAKSAHRVTPGTGNRALRSMGFATFQQHGAGYYGERGVIVAMQILRKIIPENSFSLTPFEPLGWYAVLEEVVVPTLFTHLIADDLSLSMEEASRTLHESREFGNNMHPAQTVDDLESSPELGSSPKVKAEPIDDPVLLRNTKGPVKLIVISSDEE